MIVILPLAGRKAGLNVIVADSRCLPWYEAEWCFSMLLVMDELQPGGLHKKHNEGKPITRGVIKIAAAFADLHGWQNSLKKTVLISRLTAAILRGASTKMSIFRRILSGTAGPWFNAS
jgi:hypothetical protein